MTYDKPVTIQIQDAQTEEWADWLHLHARVNKNTGGQGLNAGADQALAYLNFDFRYMSVLEDIRYASQLYRIIYRGHHFKVADWDDFMEEHQTVRITGEHYEY